MSDDFVELSDEELGIHSPDDIFAGRSPLSISDIAKALAAPSRFFERQGIVDSFTILDKDKCTHKFVLKHLEVEQKNEEIVSPHGGAYVRRDGGAPEVHADFSVSTKGTIDQSFYKRHVVQYAKKVLLPRLGLVTGNIVLWMQFKVFAERNGVTKSFAIRDYEVIWMGDYVIEGRPFAVWSDAEP